MLALSPRCRARNKRLAGAAALWQVLPAVRSGTPAAEPIIVALLNANKLCPHRRLGGCLPAVTTVRVGARRHWVHQIDRYFIGWPFEIASSRSFWSKGLDRCQAQLSSWRHSHALPGPRRPIRRPPRQSQVNFAHSSSSPKNVAHILCSQYARLSSAVMLARVPFAVCVYGRGNCSVACTSRAGVFQNVLPEGCPFSRRPHDMAQQIVCKRLPRTNYGGTSRRQ